MMEVSFRSGVRDAPIQTATLDHSAAEVLKTRTRVIKAAGWAEALVLLVALEDEGLEANCFSAMADTAVKWKSSKGVLGASMLAWGRGLVLS